MSPLTAVIGLSLSRIGIQNVDNRISKELSSLSRSSFLEKRFNSDLSDKLTMKSRTLTIDEYSNNFQNTEFI